MFDYRSFSMYAVFLPFYVNEEQSYYARMYIYFVVGCWTLNQRTFVYITIFFLSFKSCTLWDDKLYDYRIGQNVNIKDRVSRNYTWCKLISSLIITCVCSALLCDAVCIYSQWYVLVYLSSQFQRDTYIFVYCSCVEIKASIKFHGYTENDMALMITEVLKKKHNFQDNAHVNNKSVKLTSRMLFTHISWLYIFRTSGCYMWRKAIYTREGKWQGEKLLARTIFNSMEKKM